MRAQARRVSHAEEEESAFVSMTDMTVGFLFIMMILLAFFASQITSEDTVPREMFDSIRNERDDLIQERDDLTEKLQAANDKITELETLIEQLKQELEKLKALDPLESYLAAVAKARRDVLIQLRDAIKQDFPNLEVELSEESDALRFQGEGLFVSGRSTLTQDKQMIVARLAERLDEVLPCYTIGENSTFSADCNPDYVMIEAVQIEGHTDNVGTDILNRNLSTDRANNTFFTMTETAPSLMKKLNLRNQPVLSVAAYGPDRPVTQNETASGRATNRRIDLRFIMVTPRSTSGIDAIKQAFEKLGGHVE